MSANASSSPNPVFTANAPTFSLPEIETLLLDRYGLAARASFLASERDLTVRADASSGRSFVLKIANAAEDPVVSRFQTLALQHIARVAPDVPASRIVATREGESAFFADKDGARHVVHLLTWLPGRPLAETPQSAAQMRDLGGTLGRLARALESFSHPAADHDIVWDIRRAAQLVPLTPHIRDAALRSRIEAILARFCETILPLEPGFRAQVVHNDFNPFNLLVDPRGTDRLTGILDFGDLVRTAAIYDLAVACAYQVPPKGDPLRFVAELVAAYHDVHPVPRAELEHLFDLIAVRHAMTVTIGEWRAGRYPEKASYLLRNHARARAAIARCGAMSRAEGTSALLRACGYD